MSARWLKRLAVVAAAFLMLVLAVRVAIVRYGARRLEQARAALEEVAGPLDLASLRLPEVPEERNAGHWILEAARQAPAEGGDETLDRLAAKPAAEWSASDAQDARMVLERHETLAPLFERIATGSSSTFGIAYEHGAASAWASGSRDLPDFASVLQPMKVGMVAARKALVEREPDRFLAASRILERTAWALCRESTLISALAGDAVDRMRLRLLAEALSAGVLGPGAVASAPGAGSGCAPAFLRALRAEAALAADLASRLPDVRVEVAIEERVGRTLPGWRRVSAFLLDDLATLHAAAYMEAMTLRFQSLDLTYTDYHALEEKGALGPRHFTALWELLAPNYDQVVGRMRATESSQVLAAAAFALARFRHETGRWPPAAELQLQPLPFSGEVATLQVGEEWAEITAPATEAAYERFSAGRPYAYARPPFRWRVKVMDPASD